MAARTSLQQIMLRTLIGALVVSALVGMWAFIFGNFGETEVKILLTTLSVAYFSVTTLACTAAQQLGRSRLVWLPGLVASAAGFVVVMLCIWPKWTDDQWMAKTMVVLILFAFSFAQACLLAMPRLSAGVRWVFFSALAAIFALALVISGMVVFEVDDQWLFRLVGVLGILDGCATLAVPILYKLGNKAPPIETPAEASQPSLEIKLACPRCGQEGQYPMGSITCPQCGLGLRVEVLDDPGFPQGGPTGPPQYRLRTLLVVFLVASVFLGWMGTRLEYLRRQRTVIARLEEAGVTVGYHLGNVMSLSRDETAPGRLNPEDLAGIEQLVEIEAAVDFSDGQTTDEHLKQLAGLRHLQVLHLRNSKITNDGLAHLVGLRELDNLILTGTSVSDQGIRHLKQMPWLKFIQLTNTKVSKAGLAQLRRAFPGTPVLCENLDEPEVAADETEARPETEKP